MKWRPNGTQWVNPEREIYQREKVLDLHRWDHSRLQHLLREQKPEFLQRPHTKRTENGPKNYRTIRKSISNPMSNPVFSYVWQFGPSKTNLPVHLPSPEPGRIQKPVDARAGVKVGKSEAITWAINAFPKEFSRLNGEETESLMIFDDICRYNISCSLVCIIGLSMLSASQEKSPTEK